MAAGLPERRPAVWHEAFDGKVLPGRLCAVSYAFFAYHPLSAAGCGGRESSLHFSVRFLIYYYLCRETLGSEEEEEE